MGRNVFGSLGIISLSLICFLCFSGFLFSQSSKKKDDLSYSLKMKFPVNISNVYKMKEITNVKRSFSDSTNKEYTRDLTWYFTQKVSSSSKDGFTVVEVVIDSVEYKFKEGEAEFKFNSQGDDPGVLTFEDVQSTTVPLGKSYEMTYNPYWEVSKIEGENLEWLRNYVLKDGKVLDTLKKILWLDGISIERLSHITDIKKLTFPVGPVEPDSVWRSPFTIQLDGINFYDTLKTNIPKHTSGFQYIDGTTDKIFAQKNPTRFYGIKNTLVSIDSCKGKGTYSLTITPRGSIRTATADFNVEILARVNKETFKETIVTKINWELIGQFKN